MMFSPSLVVFISCIMFSIFLVSSSSSWLLCWVGIELNTLAFIPLMLLFKTGREGESAIKYFLSQTIASVLFLVGILGVKASLGMFMMLICLGLFIKMGVAPFHSWVVSVGVGLNWFSLYVMLTLQKINPLVLLVSSKWSWDLLVIGMLFSGVVGSIMGLSQTNLRALLIFSSISHIAWLLAALSSSLNLLAVYFLIYCFLLMPIVLFSFKNNLGYLNQVFSLPTGSLSLLLVLGSLLSLGGLPPFLGFFPKWLVISELVVSGNYFLVLFLVMMSLFTLFYYLRISYSGLILTKLTVEPRWIVDFGSVTMTSTLVFSFIGFMLVYLY